MDCRPGDVETTTGLLTKVPEGAGGKQCSLCSAGVSMLARLGQHAVAEFPTYW